jgi:orotidine-5'-phosphate decarboxylase
MNDRIIVALDVDNLAEAKALVKKIPQARYFKVGLQAYLEYGEKITQFLTEQNRHIFLDLKFMDIPNTVKGAVTAVLRHKPRFLTVHLFGGGEMVRAAVEASAEATGCTVLGVTVLTSLNKANLDDFGITNTVEDTVLRLCETGLKNGINSFVCSPLEIDPIRERFGKSVKLVTPGIRPEWSVKGDQKRVFTPSMAVSAGADFLVIGRPITQHASPQQAFDMIIDEIEYSEPD